MKSRAFIAAIYAGLFVCLCAMPISSIIPSVFEWTSWAACPEGTTIDVSKRPNSGRSGYRVMVVCFDDAGRPVDANQTLGLVALFGMFFGGMFAIGFLLLTMNSLRTPTSSTASTVPPMLASPLRADQEESLRRLLSSGKQLEAIRRVHKLSGLSLKESKDYIAYLERGQPKVAGASGFNSQVQQPDSGKGHNLEFSGADEGVMAKLSELKQLLDADLITSADYETKKQELLARM